MKLSPTRWMGCTDTVDPFSLVEGDKVEVCMCDTGATCVWSYPATARVDGKGVRLDADDPKLVNHSGEEMALRPEGVDGCYTYLTKPWRQAK